MLSRTLLRASSSVIIANHFGGNRQFATPIKSRARDECRCWQSAILGHILATHLVRWLSGRKQRFAKAPYPKRVPRVRIPPSPRPSLIRQIADPHRTARSREPEIRTPFDCPCLQSARVKATSISGQHYCSASRERNPSLTASSHVRQTARLISSLCSSEPEI